MRRGFTLIELLVVISIIGILMGILLVAYQGTRKQARDGRRKADLEQIRSALEMCRADAGSYPSSLNFGGSLVCGGNTYLSLIPKDPLDPIYIYRYSLDGTTYSLCTFLETGSGNVGCGSCGNATCNYKVSNP